MFLTFVLLQQTSVLSHQESASSGSLPEGSTAQQGDQVCASAFIAHQILYVLCHVTAVLLVNSASCGGDASSKQMTVYADTRQRMHEHIMLYSMGTAENRSW